MKKYLHLVNNIFAKRKHGTHDLFWTKLLIKIQQFNNKTKLIFLYGWIGPSGNNKTVHLPHIFKFLCKLPYKCKIKCQLCIYLYFTAVQFLSKKKSEILGSGLKEKHLLESWTSIYHYRTRNEHLHHIYRENGKPDDPKLKRFQTETWNYNSTYYY